jgi:hypothetical protein
MRRKNKVAGNGGGAEEEEGVDMWGPHVSDEEEVRWCGSEGVTQWRKRISTKAQGSAGLLGRWGNKRTWKESRLAWPGWADWARKQTRIFNWI